MQFSRTFAFISSGAGIAILAAAVAGCAGSTTAPLSGAYVPNPSAKAVAVQSWSRSMIQVPLPASGCFRATFPAVVWSRVACVAPPNVAFPAPARHGRTPAIVGGSGYQYGIDVLPLTMLGAIGSINDASGAKAITSCAPAAAKSFSCGKKGLGPNVYSLQLNSNFYSTAACGGTVACVGWEQFVYTNQPSYYHGGGELIIQDWLIATGSNTLACPSGWIVSKPDCYENAPYSVLVPTVPIGQIAGVSLAGSATSSGDSVFFTVGTLVYGMKNAQNDGTLDLSDHWTSAQFNIIGNSSGNRAVLNQGATFTLSVEAVTGYNVAPRCRGEQSTTAEENNLSFVAPPSAPQRRQYPSIVYKESNASNPVLPAACVALAGL